MSGKPWQQALKRWGNEWPLSAGWIPLASEASVRSKPVACLAAGVPFVLWRDSRNEPKAALNQCPHMGVRLETGRVDASGRLRCPLHGWAFGGHGRCMDAPGHAQVPNHALQVFPTETALGWVFGYLGPLPGHPLPRFLAPGLVAGTQLTFQAEVPWHLISANGFDGPHFEHVHGRRPLRPSTHSAPHSDAFVVEHDLDIVGQGWADRFLRWVDGGPIRMRYEVWGGHSVLAEMRFRRMTSRLVIYILPDGPGRSLVRMWPLSHSRLDLPLRCWLTRSFFEHEFREIRGAKLHPASLTPADHGQEAFLDWLASRLQDQNRIE